MGVRPILKWAFAGTLLVSVGLKVPGTVTAQADTLLATTEAAADFLKRHGFAVQGVTQDLDLVIMRANDDGCHLRVAVVAPQGWHDGVVRHLAGPDESLFFVFEGETSPEQPIWRTRLKLYETLLKRRLGFTPAYYPVLGVMAGKPCKAEALPWTELATLPMGAGDTVAPQPQRAATAK